MFDQQILYFTYESTNLTYSGYLDTCKHIQSETFDYKYCTWNILATLTTIEYEYTKIHKQNFLNDLASSELYPI